MNGDRGTDVSELSVGPDSLDSVLVTIIVPMYNSARYVRRTIESCLEQTHRNIELILVDDGSPDDCGSIAEEYARRDSRVRVIRQANGGVSVARNAALDVCTGDWVCFIDGDDYVLPDYVGYLLRGAIAHDAPISLTRRIYWVHDAHQVLPADGDAADDFSVVSGEDATEMIMLYAQPIGPWCKLFRRQFIEEHHIRFIPGMFNGEGFNFGTFAFQRADRVAVGSRRLYAYRRDNPTSGTREVKVQHCESALRGVSTIEANLRLQTPRIKRALRFAKWNTNTHVLGRLTVGGVAKEYPDLYVRCRAIVRRNALCVFSVPVGIRYKAKGLLYWAAPTIGCVLEHWWSERKPLR